MSGNSIWAAKASRYFHVELPAPTQPVEDDATRAPAIKDGSKLRRRAEMQGLAERGIGAIWSYPGFVAILLFVAPPVWIRQHLGPLFTLGTVSIASSSLRAMLIWRWSGWIEKDPSRWWVLWTASLLTAAAAWGLFFSWSFAAGDEIHAVVAISLAGICAGAMINSVPSWPLMIMFESIALIPSSVTALFRSTRGDLALAVLIWLFLFFLLAQGRQVNRKFWESYDMHLSLLERTRLMEDAVGLAELGHSKLAASEQRYRVIFKFCPLSMWVCDVDLLRFVAVNEQAVRCYGYSREEFLSMRATEIDATEDGDALLRFLRNLNDEPMPMTQWRHRRRNGTVIDVEVTGHAIQWSGRAAVLMLSNDISDRVRAEREKDAMEVQLRHAQKLESIGQLAAGIAHEINTPTQYIGDNLHFLRDAFGDVSTVIQTQQRMLPLIETHAELRESAAEIRRAMDAAEVDYLLEEMPKALEQAIDGVGRVSTLVKAMKEFSHPGTKDKVPADLNSAIQSTITVARNEWKYVARLETDFDPNLPAVPCIVNDFNQVMLNLIVNAAHAIGGAVKDGELGLIKICTRTIGDSVEIRVEDSGTGIPVEVRERIFEPFFTTKDVGKGTGQGLAIAHSVVVDKHGGTLHFETEIGRGTTFVVRLPIASEASSSGAEAELDTWNQDEKNSVC
ncbi:MAG TPA: ATP-binding protein [Bryobacteraceae bacterium]